MTGLRRWMGALAVVLIAGVSVAACGSSSSSSSKSASSTTTSTGTTTPPPVHTGATARYVVRADAICRASVAHIRALAGKTSPQIQAGNQAGATQAVAQALDQLAAIGSAQLARLRTLSPPAEIRPLVARYYAASAAGQAILKKAATAVRNKDNAELNRLKTQLQQAVLIARRTALQIGMRVCASPVG